MNYELKFFKLLIDTYKYEENQNNINYNELYKMNHIFYN